MLTVTPMLFSASHWTIEGVRSVAFVVRLKSMNWPSSPARFRAYATVGWITLKLRRVSPPKNVS